MAKQKKVTRQQTRPGVPANVDKMGLTIFDVKRRRNTGGSEYDARSIKGIRTKTKARRQVRPTKMGG